MTQFRFKKKSEVKKKETKQAKDQQSKILTDQEIRLNA